MTRAPLRRAATALLLILVPALTGCADVVDSTPGERIGIDTGSIGRISPGLVRWLAWPKAHEYCASAGKSPELADLKGPVAVYRCVADPD